MKLLTKALSTLLLFALALTTLLACGDGDTGKSVSSEEVINQSIAKIEDMMDIESGTDITPTAFVAPNYTVDYNDERLSVLRGSSLALYFTQYIANSANGFEDNTVYKDTVSAEGVTLNVHVKKADVDNGIHVTLENHQTYNGVSSVHPIQVYFEYDYDAKVPTRTTIVAAGEADNGYYVAVAQFNYETEVAYSYNFEVSSENTATVKAALAEKNLDFATLVSGEVSEYRFAKLTPKTSAIESYSYTGYGTEEITATEAEVSALYASIYAEVKDACVPVELLDVANASAKVYYQDMYTYASGKVMAIK